MGLLLFKEQQTFFNNINKMQYLKLELIKKHLNMDESFHDDDSYLEALGDVVEEITEKHIDVSLKKLTADNNGKIPTPLKQAMLLLLATYYSNRENIAFASSSEIPLSYSYLLSLYQNYGGNEK